MARDVRVAVISAGFGGIAVSVELQKAGMQPWAFLGLTVPGFPNFAMTYGPNTNGVPSIISYHEMAAGAVIRLAKRRKVAFSGCHNYNLAPTGRNLSQWPLSHCVYGLLVKLGLPLGVRLEGARSSGGRQAEVPRVATDARPLLDPVVRAEG